MSYSTIDPQMARERTVIQDLPKEIPRESQAYLEEDFDWILQQIDKHIAQKGHQGVMRLPPDKCYQGLILALKKQGWIIERHRGQECTCLLRWGCTHDKHEISSHDYYTISWSLQMI